MCLIFGNIEWQTLSAHVIPHMNLALSGNETDTIKRGSEIITKAEKSSNLEGKTGFNFFSQVSN